MELLARGTLVGKWQAGEPMMGKERKMERTARIARVERGGFFFFDEGWARVMAIRGVRGGDGGGIVPSGNGEVDNGVPGVRGVGGWIDMGEEGG